MAFSGRPHASGNAIFSASDDTLHIVLKNGGAPNLQRLARGSVVFINGLAMFVIEATALGFKVDASAAVTNGSALYRETHDPAVLTVHVEYAGRSQRFVGVPDAIGLITVRRLRRCLFSNGERNDDEVEVSFAQHLEPAHVARRVIAIDGVAFVAPRQTNSLDNDTSHPRQRVLRVSLAAVRGTLFDFGDDADTQDAPRVWTANMSFAAVEEVPTDFSSLVRSEGEAFALALSEARMAGHVFWGRRAARFFPVGAVLVDRPTGLVVARVRNADGGVLGPLCAWLAVNAAATAAWTTDLALYMTAPSPCDTAAQVASAEKRGVRAFMYAYDPMPPGSITDRPPALARTELSLASTPELVLAGEFYRAITYARATELPYVTWARALDVTSGRPPSYANAVLLPAVARNSQRQRFFLMHLGENAQATLECRDDLGTATLRWTVRAGPVVLASVQGRDGSMLEEEEEEEDEEGKEGVQSFVDEVVPFSTLGASREVAVAWLRSRNICHLLLVGSGTVARQWSRWRLVRERALFGLSADIGREELLFLAPLGKHGEGFFALARDTLPTKEEEEAAEGAEAAATVAAEITEPDDGLFLVQTSAPAPAYWLVQNAQGVTPLFFSLSAGCAAPLLLVNSVQAAARGVRDDGAIDFKQRLTPINVAAAVAMCAHIDALVAVEPAFLATCATDEMVLHSVVGTCCWEGKAAPALCAKLGRCFSANLFDRISLGMVLLAPLDLQHVEDIDILGERYGLRTLSLAE